MAWMRTTWGSRLSTAVLLVGLLTGVAVPGATAVDTARYATYADWLRSEARGPVDEAFEVALERAAETRPRSLSDFLEAFVDGFEARQPGGEVAAVFAVADLPHDALITYLQNRYQRLGNQGMAPRPVIKMASLQAASLGGGHVAGDLRPSALLAAPFAGLAETTSLLPLSVRLLLRTLSSARPLGP